MKNLIDGLEKGRNSELVKFEQYATKKPYEFSDVYYSNQGETWEATVREKDVTATIKLMESKF